MFEASTDVEMVNLNPANGVQLPCVTPAQLPESRDEHISTFSNNLLYVCAGYTRTGCRAYDNETNVWDEKGQMDRERALAAAVMLNNDEWWITGGDQDEAQVGTDTTIIYDMNTDQSSAYVTLPQPMWRHSLVKISDSEYFIIGGATLDDSKAYIFNSDDESFEELDPPGISILKAFVGLVELDDGTLEIVSTGGDNDPVGTHIFNLESRTWRQGTDFPAPFFDGVSVPYGKTFLAVGGIDHDNNISDSIYYYDVGTESWGTTNRVLQEGRYFHSAAIVPQDFVQCF